MTLPHPRPTGCRVDPGVWKIEGLDRSEDCQRIVAVAREGGRDHVGCIVLGRGEDERKVREWLGIAAQVPGFIGFAVGRTVFWDALVAWRAKTGTREQAVARVAGRYREFVDLISSTSTPFINWRPLIRPDRNTGLEMRKASTCN